MKLETAESLDLLNFGYQRCLENSARGSELSATSVIVTMYLLAVLLALFAHLYFAARKSMQERPCHAREAFQSAVWNFAGDRAMVDRPLDTRTVSRPSNFEGPTETSERHRDTHAIPQPVLSQQTLRERTKTPASSRHSSEGRSSVASSRKTK